MNSTIEIVVDGETIQVPEGTTVTKLKEFGFINPGSSDIIRLNGTTCPAENQTRSLCEDDEVDVVPGGGKLGV